MDKTPEVPTTREKLKATAKGFLGIVSAPFRAAVRAITWLWELARGPQITQWASNKVPGLKHFPMGARLAAVLSVAVMFLFVMGNLYLFNPVVAIALVAFAPITLPAILISSSPLWIPATLLVIYGLGVGANWLKEVGQAEDVRVAECAAS